MSRYNVDECKAMYPETYNTGFEYGTLYRVSYDGLQASAMQLYCSKYDLIHRGNNPQKELLALRTGWLDGSEGARPPYEYDTRTPPRSYSSKPTSWER